MAYRNTIKPYNPYPANKKMLERAWFHIQSVPYSPSLRWLFYRLYDDRLHGMNFFESKDDYKVWRSGPMSDARVRFYEDNETGMKWRPWTLEDDTRPVYVRHGRFQTIDEWQNWKDNLEPDMDEFYSQKYYIEVWFEARAMLKQFAYYLPEYITLVPFGGDYTISPKWEAARRIKNAHEKYGLPIKIIYFGDYDAKGKKIPQSALQDIQPWAGVDFDFKVAGLNKDQVERFNLPEDPDKPGEKQYQWESLSDSQAREIISEAISPYIKE